MYTYILCEFNYGYTGQFYQEIENGNVIRYVNLDGTTLTLPGRGEVGGIPYGYTDININPTRPAWADPI